MPLTYVLPLKWSDDLDRDELARYLERLSTWADEVIVVDGSNDEEFANNARAWGSFVSHLRPDPVFGFLNGKVNGVTTGVLAATHEHVVIADDDVRYDEDALARVAALLEDADLVRPQNYFPPPMPWHATLDTARTLLNRAFGADFPGTFGVRRSFFDAMGGYDGDVLFENLELIRAVERHGGRVVAPLDLYVARLAPTTQRFVSQRVRQAYDDFALPLRMALWLAYVPAMAAVFLRRRSAALGLVAVPVAVAELGRRKAAGRRVFPAAASLCAPLWLAERGVSAWFAVVARARGGVRYGDRRLFRSANPS
ncbi:MAG TPA: glycosyltransferase family 2 protein [Actinomycetota bacterium]|nr:glycosyltransferase family 2 protein [Actinomycetota bacterium]